MNFTISLLPADISVTRTRTISYRLSYAAFDGVIKRIANNTCTSYMKSYIATHVLIPNKMTVQSLIDNIPFCKLYKTVGKGAISLTQIILNTFTGLYLQRKMPMSVPSRLNL